LSDGKGFRVDYEALRGVGAGGEGVASDEGKGVGFVGGELEIFGGEDGDGFDGVGLGPQNVLGRVEPVECDAVIGVNVLELAKPVVAMASEDQVAGAAEAGATLHYGGAEGESVWRGVVEDDFVVAEAGDAQASYRVVIGPGPRWVRRAIVS
jgi:hypothetical protein